jgi:hypothetical protein
MSVARPPGSRRLPLAAVLFLFLSILLHLALLGSVPALQLAGDAPITATPVVIQLQAAAAPEPQPPPASKAPKRRTPRKPPPIAPAPTPDEVPHGEAPHRLGSDSYSQVAQIQSEPASTLAPTDPIGSDSHSAKESDPIPAKESDPIPAKESDPIPAKESDPIPQPLPPTRVLPPPPAQLHYNVETKRSDGNYQGTGIIRFSQDGAQYSVDGEVKLLFMSLLTFRSNGSIEPHGLAPLLYTEKRFRKSATNTHFQREKALVSFSASTLNFARSGLEQDRASIVWQLASLGRGDPAQLAPGAELDIFVAGTRDGETWRLQVTGEEDVQVANRVLRAVRILRRPRPGSYEQQLDIWLAPTMEWYPVKLRFTEPNGDVLNLTLNNAPEPLAAQ